MGIANIACSCVLEYPYLIVTVLAQASKLSGFTYCDPRQGGKAPAHAYIQLSGGLYLYIA